MTTDYYDVFEGWAKDPRLLDDAPANLQPIFRAAATLHGRRDDSPQAILDAQLAAVALIESIADNDTAAHRLLLPTSVAELEVVVTTLAGMCWQLIRAQHPGDEAGAMQSMRESLIAYGARRNTDDTEDEQ